MQTNNGMTALHHASMFGQTAVVRELIAADGSVEHLRMKNKTYGKTALDHAKNDEIKALLTAAEAAADLKGKAQAEEKGRKRGCICM